MDFIHTFLQIGTGFSDDDLQKHSESLKTAVIPNAKSYYRYNQQLVPDVWFDAVQVWEVKCADLSLSPVHTAAEGLVCISIHQSQGLNPSHLVMTGHFLKNVICF